MSYTRYQQHLRYHRDDNKYSCSECSFITHSKRGLAIHSSAMHGEEAHGSHGDESHETHQLVEDNPRNMPNSVSVLTCNICGFRSNHARGFKRHVTCMHSRKRWKESRLHQNYEGLADGENSFSVFYCDMCDFSTSCRTGLKRHVTCKHLRPSLDDSLDQVSSPHIDDTPEKVSTPQGDDSSVFKYFCNYCHFSSVHRRGFKKHMSCMHDVTDIEADGLLEGDFSVLSESESARSFLRSDKKPYECPQCERTFESYQLYHQHEVLGCGRYRCRYCKMKYRASEREEYLAHIQLHQEKDASSYKCNKCSFVTHLKKKLEVHICSDNGAKSLCCPWCTFQCTNQDVLQSHISSNHEKGFHEDEAENEIAKSSGENDSALPNIPNSNINHEEDFEEMEEVSFNDSSDLQL